MLHKVSSDQRGPEMCTAAGGLERPCAVHDYIRGHMGQSIRTQHYVLRLLGETQTHSVRDQTLRHKSWGSREGGAV